MNSLVASALFASAALTLVAPVDSAQAADPAAGSYRERVYSRPVPRVYYQPVRPTMVCQVAYIKEQRWPRERDHTVRCVDFR